MRLRLPSAISILALFPANKKRNSDQNGIWDKNNGEKINPAINGICPSGYRKQTIFLGLTRSHQSQRYCWKYIFKDGANTDLWIPEVGSGA
jgi:hypothetical protein